jgi:hypothetical protein
MTNKNFKFDFDVTEENLDELIQSKNFENNSELLNNFFIFYNDNLKHVADFSDVNQTYEYEFNL